MATTPIVPPEVWVGWRRPQGSAAAWEKVPGIEPGTKSAVYAALSRQVLIVSETAWEYDMCPQGQMPGERRRSSGPRGPISQTYKNRMMRGA